jgi:hypothetical protein
MESPSNHTFSLSDLLLYVLSFFRTNQASAGLFLFLYALILQLPGIFGWVEVTPALVVSGIGGTWLMQWTDGQFYLATLLPVLFVTIQGIIANVLVTRHRMSRKITQFPGLFIILFWAMVPSFRALHPVQVANIFLLLALLSMGRLYKKEEAAVPLFNAGAWLAIATLFSPMHLVLIPAFIIGIGILRRITFKSIFQLLTGTIVILSLVFSYAYLTGVLPTALSYQFSALGWWQLPSLPSLQLPGLIVLALLLLLSITAYRKIVRFLNIEGKKNVGIQYWLLLFFLLSILVSGVSGIPYFQVITVPLGLLLGLRFILLSDGKAEFYHLILLTSAMGVTIWAVFT